MSASGPHSGLPVEHIQQFLQAIRSIARLPDDEAIIEADKFLAEMLTSSTSESAASSEEWEHKRARDALDRLRAQIDRVRNGIAVAHGELLWDGRNLEMEAQQIDISLNSETKAVFAKELSAIRADAKKVSEAAQIAGHRNLIKEYQVRPLHSANSVKSVIAGVDESLTALGKLGALTEDVMTTARSAKERCGRYRFQKKIDEAQVAQAGGNEKKAEKLRKEATVLLAQDWAQALPGESPPAL